MIINNEHAISFTIKNCESADLTPYILPNLLCCFTFQGERFSSLLNPKHTLELSFAYVQNANPSLDKYFDISLDNIIAILVFSPYQQLSLN